MKCLKHQEAERQTLLCEDVRTLKKKRICCSGQYNYSRQIFSGLSDPTLLR